MTQCIYLPSTDNTDPLFRDGSRQFAKMILRPDNWNKCLDTSLCPIIDSGGGGLAEKRTIYVFGHGNMGAGIGTAKKHMGSETLSQALIRDGLRSGSGGLTIHLYACNTGVDMSRIVYMKGCYAARFAAHMATHGFDNTTVIGYVGFLSPWGDKVSMRYNMRTHQCMDPSISNPLSSPAAQRVYTVNARVVTPPGGQNYTSSRNLFAKVIEVLAT